MLSGRITESRLAVACLTWVVVAFTGSVILEVENGPATANLKTVGDVLFGLFVLAPGLAGALTLRLTANRVAGWLLIGATTVGWTSLLLHAVVVALARSDLRPGVLVWPALWLGGPAFAVLALVPGRVRNPGRRPALEPVGIVAIAALAAALALGDGPLTGVGVALQPIRNPLVVPAVAGLAERVIAVAPLFFVAYGGLGLVLLAWDRFGRRRRLGPEVTTWAVLGIALPLTILAGVAIGAAGGWGRFEGGWVAAVVTPLVVLVVASALVVRAWSRDRSAAEILRRDAAAREAERERVRRDLHDGIGPALAGMRLQLDGLRDRIPADAAGAHSAADRLESALDETLGELRRIVDGMQPSTLERDGLRAALAGLTTSMTAGRQGLTRVELELAPDLPDLPIDVEAALLRVCAEALSNAIRHADPRTCLVALGWDGRVARLRIDDDGIGMNGSHDGVGLRSMSERVAALGGVLNVGARESGPGTSVVAIVPVQSGGKTR